MNELVGRVAELWRYPIKALGGESVGRFELSARGAEMDRYWALRGADGKIGSSKTTRRFRRVPGLLSVSAHGDADGSVIVTFGDGTEAPLSSPECEERLSEIAGEPLQVVAEADVSHFDSSPLHLLTTSSLEWLARRVTGTVVAQRRFRPNLVIESHLEGRPEESWIGRHIMVGGALLQMRKRTERCVVTTMAQPGLEFSPQILGSLKEGSEECLGVYALVIEAAPISVGDEVRLLD